MGRPAPDSLLMPTTAPPHPRLTPSDRRLIGIAAGLTTIIFLVDLELPRGITVCALYGVVILLGLFVRVRGFSLWAAIVAHSANDFMSFVVFGL